MRLVPTASQTVGPFFHIGLSALFRSEIAPPGVPGERVAVSGRVLDAGGRPVPDALVEVWQADAGGRYPHPDDPRAGEVDPRFQGFGRVATDAGGAFRFTTVRPGRVPGPGGALQAPHLAVSVFMRGLLARLVTRMYFPDPSCAEDPILARVDPARRHTLVATPSAGDASTLRWDVALQGPDETVFLEW